MNQWMDVAFGQSTTMVGRKRMNKATNSIWKKVKLQYSVFTYVWQMYNILYIDIILQYKYKKY